MNDIIDTIEGSLLNQQYGREAQSLQQLEKAMQKTKKDIT